MLKHITIGLVLLAGLGLGGWYLFSGKTHASPFRTVPVERGNLLASINATGTIEPEEVVDIGAQVAGQIVSFGNNPYDEKKTIDFGTPVEKDTVLARIDAALYQAAVDRAKAQRDLADAGVDSANAQVAVSEANLQRAKADLKQMEAKLDQTTNDFRRNDRMVREGAVAASDFDLAKAAYLTAQSTLAVDKAMIVQAEASLVDARVTVKKAEASRADAKAALLNAEINLGYCVIKSPVKGVIVDRRVNIGQTVVSSLNAPSLFLIAKDLKRLQVWASVNEADIGNIFPGQTATFSVDAFPDRVFKGTVAPAQPRLNASMTQNVVTYTVVVETDNTDGKLLPYLTSNLQFEVSKRTNVLLVPNSTLRYKPAAELVVPDARDDYVRRQQRTKAAPGEPAPLAAEPKKEHRDRGTLWVAEGAFVRPVKVQIGLSDGLSTEIVKGDVEEGAAVVTGETHGNANAGTNNPFAPKMFGGSGKKE